MIYALHFHKNADGSDYFSFGGWSVREAAGVFARGHAILHAYIQAESSEGYLGEAIMDTFSTMGAFNHFFGTHPAFGINNLSLLLEKGLRLGGHDERTVHLSALPDESFNELLSAILAVKGLPPSLVDAVRLFPGAYLAVDPSGIVLSIHETFDEYLDHFPE